MTSANSRSFCIGFLCVVLGLFATTAVPGFAAPPETTSPSWHAGFNDFVKLGHWVPVTITVPVDQEREPIRYAINMLDGDETPVTYEGPLTRTEPARDGHQTFEMLCRFGRRFGVFHIRLFDAAEASVFESDGTIQDSEIQFDSSTDHLTILVSDNEAFGNQIEKATLSNLRDGNRRLVRLNSGQPIPVEPVAWQSVNRIIVPLQSATAMHRDADATWSAMERWVGQGGELVLVGGEALSAMEISPSLNRLLPMNIGEAQRLDSGRTIERFVGNSRQQLIGRNEQGPLFSSLEIDEQFECTTIVEGESGSPLVVRYPHGLGEVTIVAFDLESETITGWSSYPVLLEKIFNRQIIDQKESRTASTKGGSAVTHFGYNDLAGQLLVPLDDFTTVRFLDFTLIAVLISVYILAISVGDWFLLKRLLGRMELTWITFPLTALLFCGIAWTIASLTRPSSIQINQMEILDFDTVNRTSRGTSWMNLYSPSARTIDVAIASETDQGLPITRSIVSWQGLPGDGLGGMETQTTTGFQRIAYRQELEAGQLADGVNCTIKSLPLRVSSTRSLVGRFEMDDWPEFPAALRLKRDRLEGTIENTMPFDIFNARIFFGGYVYLLDQPFRAGDVLSVKTQTKEKTSRNYLNRAAVTGFEEKELGKSQVKPWDPRDKSLTRIADIMMFYSLAGGENYTGLTHGYYPEMDQSELLTLGRAILVGQIASGSRIEIDGEDTRSLYDDSITMVRIVLNVER